MVRQLLSKVNGHKKPVIAAASTIAMGWLVWITNSAISNGQKLPVIEAKAAAHDEWAKDTLISVHDKIDASESAIKESIGAQEKAANNWRDLKLAWDQERWNAQMRANDLLLSTVNRIDEKLDRVQEKLP